MNGLYVKYWQNTRLDTQRGQALVLGLFLVMLLAVALIYQFGVGQVVGRKARLIHAADAAAYSGALVQARALNMQAYINLTQTAHQVAMAHLVTLGSWSCLLQHRVSSWQCSIRLPM